MTDMPAAPHLKVLAIHRYYWPDAPPYASMLRAIVARWAADGHTVSVLSSQPSYKRDADIPRQPAEQELDGVAVRRLDLPAEHGRLLTRLANVVRFSWAIFRHARNHGPYDVIMASTVPPVVVGAAARLAARFTGARFVYHCMDIHPEIGRISGEFRNPLIFSLLRRIDAGNCRAAARVVVLSKDMEVAIGKRSGVYDANIEVINNFNLPSFSGEQPAGLPAALEKGEGQFRLLFAGNIGRFQGLEAVVDAMFELGSRLNIELVFLGEGRAVSDLKARSGKFLGGRIRFFPHQSVDVARQVIRTADLCLVTLAQGIYQYAFPSKTMTYLGEGRPLLVCVESCSELAAFVRAENVGIAVDPGSPQALAAAIAELVDDPLRYREMEEQAARAGKQYFDQSTVLDRWSGFMRELAAET